MSETFIDYFSELEDPRIERCKKHELLDILFLSICAVLAGADGWEDIESFGRLKLPWLQKFLLFGNGIPKHDTIARVISRLEPEGFQRSFTQWIQRVADLTAGEVVAIDGKTARGSFKTRHRRHALHLVSAWASGNGVVLGQLRTQQKSNEVRAIPKLLEVLELKGCIVTIDAMGCQSAIAEKIVKKGAHYVLAAKANQGSLYESIKDYFAAARQAGFQATTHSYHEQTDQGHDRIEVRRCWQFTDVGYLEGQARWPRLASFAVVEAERHLHDKVTCEQRCYISSLALDAKRLAEAVRSHWAIENSLHWVLDVSFNEDSSRIRRGHAAENLAVLRRLALNLIKRDTSRQDSLKKKRKLAGWDDDFRETLLFGAST